MKTIAFVVGINEYPHAAAQQPLNGAVNDACDFAEWALDPMGGNVAPDDLFFWTYPWLIPAGGRLAQALEEGAPAWSLDPGPIGPPDQTRPPRANEIVNTAEQKARELRQANYGADTPQTSRVLVFFAGHGLRTKELYSNNPPQTCFIAGNFAPSTSTIAEGLVPTDSLRRSLKMCGFDEVILFLDCCRNEVIGLRHKAQPLSDLENDLNEPPWGVGNASVDGRPAFETTDAPVRGAFSTTLMRGLREHRHPETGALTILQLKEFVEQNIAGATGQDQFPDFKFEPPNQPLELLSGGVPNAAAPKLAPGPVVSFDGIPIGTRFVLKDGGLDLIDGLAPITFDGNDIELPPLEIGLLYILEQEDDPNRYITFSTQAEEWFMSDSPQKDRPTGKLQVDAPIGIRYKISNATGKLSVSGIGPNTIELEQGLYEVVWQSGGKPRSEFVRLLAGEQPTVVTYDFEQSSATRSKISSINSTRQKIREDFPSEQDYGSAVFIVVDDAQNHKDPLRSIRLLNSNSVAMRSKRGKSVGEDIFQEGFSRYYAVKPGDYLLNFPALTGETLQLSVPALRGRTTLVLLNTVSGTVLLSHGKEFEGKQSTGIDVQRTTIISAASHETDEQILESARLARTLLADLARRTTSLDRNFVNLLGNRETDPLLRIYGSAVAIAAIKDGRSPFPRSLSTGGVPINHTDLESAWNTVYDWLNLDTGMHIGQDESVLRWVLSDLGYGSRHVYVRRQLESPPMLALLWDWAIAHSQRDKTAIPDRIANVGGTRSMSARGQWLVWKASSLKASAAPVVEQEQSLETLANDLASKSQELSELSQKTRQASRIFKSGSLDGESLTDGLSSSTLALGGLSASNTMIVESTLKVQRGEATFDELGVALKLPGDALRRRMSQTATDMDVLIENLGRTDPSEDYELPPAMFEPVLFPDDLNQGRFGGKESSNGYSLRARFAPTKNRAHTQITILIDGPAPDGTRARLYLHDSFHQPEREVIFGDGQASLTVRAWGGFTVGAWVERDRVQLELNLAKAPGAPKGIRSR